jgi:HAD superfamily phosphoserine phosphatase-like hydrolase
MWRCSCLDTLTVSTRPARPWRLTRVTQSEPWTRSERNQTTQTPPSGTHYLFASDFDQTLSFNDSGAVLTDLIGASRFEEKVTGLARTNLVHQGAELAYLLRHDPDFRTVRRSHLIEVGRRVRLKKDIPLLMNFLSQGIQGARFSFYVVSASPREVIQSALEGVVPPDHIFGTELDYEPDTGEIRSVSRVPAGYGKVAALEEIEKELKTRAEHTVYVGDGRSDIHAMLHVNNRDGFTISVSENRHLAQIAKRTVLSDNAFSVVVPLLEHVFGWHSAEIRALFQSYGLPLQDWQRIRTDLVMVD